MSVNIYTSHSSQDQLTRRAVRVLQCLNESEPLFITKAINEANKTINRSFLVLVGQLDHPAGQVVCLQLSERVGQIKLLEGFCDLARIAFVSNI